MNSCSSTFATWGRKERFSAEMRNCLQMAVPPTLFLRSSDFAPALPGCSTAETTALWWFCGLRLSPCWKWVVQGVLLSEIVSCCDIVLCVCSKKMSEICPSYSAFAPAAGLVTAAQAGDDSGPQRNKTKQKNIWAAPRLVIPNRLFREGNSGARAFTAGEQRATPVLLVTSLP